MREIKFRVWIKRHNKIFNLDSLKWSVDNKLVVSSSTPEGLLSNVWFAPDKLDNLRNVIHIMQYTGLKDKNGKEIYEGDILNMTYHGSVSIVKPEIKGVIGFERGTFIIEENGISLGKIGRSLEVIGNIYENPELLKGDIIS